MTTVTAAPARWTFEDELDALGVSTAGRLPAHLEDAPASTMLWCFECERAFALASVREARGELSCAYADCDAEPMDFWQWDAYRAFVGEAPAAPAAGVRYSLGFRS